MTDYLSIISADGKQYTRGTGSSVFIGCLGVCLGFSDPLRFKEKYDEIVNTLFEPIITQTRRNVLKSYDIHENYWRNKVNFLSVLQSFTREVTTQGVVVNVVFTTFNPQKVPDGISIFGTGRTPEEKKDVLSFLKMLEQYYPYIAAWKVSKTAQLRRCEVYLDNFSSPYLSPAWDELCAHHTVKVYPHGDACNKYISTADIITRYIDEYLYANKLHLTEDSILAALDACHCDDYHIFYTGHPDLTYIVPKSKEQIDFKDYSPNPVFYLIRDKGFDHEQSFIENSPSWAKLLNLAESTNGCIKYLDQQKDSKCIKSGDHLVYYSEKGKYFAESLKNMGYEVNMLEFSKIR